MRGFLCTRFGVAATLVLAAVGGYLLYNHSGHAVAAIPYLILLACPLMHVFGHRHGHKHAGPTDGGITASQK